MTNGALANYANRLTAVVVGNEGGQTGSLLIEDESVISTAGAPFFSFGTYGTEDVFNGAGYIGLNTGSTGQVTVTGAGSQFDTAWVLSVGWRGSGELEVSNGGTVTSTSYRIGALAGATGDVTVTGAGSTLTGGHLGFFDVGVGGVGTLNVQDGGSVSNYTTILGDSAGTGIASVTGTGSQWTVTQSMYIAGDNNSSDPTSSGSLTVGNGGVAQVGNLTRVYEGGEVILNSGGTLETESLTAHAPGNVEFNGGELRLTGGTLDLGGTADITAGSSLSGVGTVQGDVINAGTIKPGTSPGILAITGDYAQTELGVTEFEIAGSLAGTEYDVLSVSGTATLSGVLRITLDSFDPVESDFFKIMDFDNLVDNGFTFDLSSAVLNEGLYWNTDNFHSSGTLHVIPEPGLAALLGLGLITLLAHRARPTRAG